MLKLVIKLFGSFWLTLLYQTNDHAYTSPGMSALCKCLGEWAGYSILSISQYVDIIPLPCTIDIYFIIDLQ